LYIQPSACVLLVTQAYLYVGDVWKNFYQYRSASPDNFSLAHDRKYLVIREKFLPTSKQPCVNACIASNTLSYG